MWERGLVMGRRWRVDKGGKKGRQEVWVTYRVEGDRERRACW